MEEGNKIGNVSSITHDNQLGIKASSTPFASCFYFQDYYDEKEVKKFIKNVETLIRRSREYNAYIELLRTNHTQLNHDNILHNITTSDADLEFHHYPFTLYEIVEICMNQHILAGTNFTTFSIAKEVMDLHYANIIGLVPLSKTMHELAHDNAIFISTDQVFGNYKKFMKDYNNAISAEKKVKIQDIEAKTKANNPSDFGGLL